MELMSCSIDGTVAYMDFSIEEIGSPLSKEDVVWFCFKSVLKRQHITVSVVVLRNSRLYAVDGSCLVIKNLFLIKKLRRENIKSHQQYIKK